MRKHIVALAVMLGLASGILLMPVTAMAEGSTNASTKTGGNIVVQTIPGPTVSERLTSRARSSWPWYVTRASGIVAAASLVILMLSGIGQVTGYTFRFLEPLTAWASHRALGLTFGISVLVHIFSLLFDHFIPFSLWQVLVPWLSHYKPVSLFGISFGSLYVALGVLAFYLTIFVVVTSLLWVEKKPYTWKLFHLLSYLIMAFVFVHALYLGTDLAHGFWRWLWLIASGGVAAAILYRMWGAKTI